MREFPATVQVTEMKSIGHTKFAIEMAMGTFVYQSIQRKSPTRSQKYKSNQIIK
jgi:hypothetical protein